MTLRAAVLGHPISHSKSPALHRAAYAHLGVEHGLRGHRRDRGSAAGVYGTGPGGPAAGEGWRGLSVTMPLKSGMVREVDEVRGVARGLGVVNTVAFEAPPAGDGAGPTRLVGYNTDVAGIVNALRHAGAASAPSAVVLGGGGTAAAAVAALKELGAPDADIYVRDVSRAAEAKTAAAAVGLAIRVLPLSRGSRRPGRGRRRDFHVAAPRRGPAGGGAGGRRWRSAPAGRPLTRLRPGPVCCWTSPMIPGPAGSPSPGRTPAAPWSRGWRC